eukprot:3652-Eustigmatos_ZCMA.PRE.1
MSAVVTDAVSNDPMAFISSTQAAYDVPVPLYLTRLLATPVVPTDAPLLQLLLPHAHILAHILILLYERPRLRAVPPVE